MNSETTKTTDQTIDHATRGHHPYSPSSLQARELSPCFRPRQQASESAAEASRRGTMQHEAVDKASDDPRMSDEEADAVTRALSMVENTRRVILKSDPSVEIYEFKEEYLPIDDDEVVDGSGQRWLGTTGGFPDQVLCWRPKDFAPHERHAVVFDWKFGRYAVAAAQHNRQLHSYILGVRHKLSKMGLVLRSAQGVFFSPHRGEPPNTFTFRQTPSDPLVFETLYGEVVTCVRRSELIDKAIDKVGFRGLSDELKGLVIPSPKCIFCDRLKSCTKIAQVAEMIALAVKPLSVPSGNINLFEERDPEVLAKAVVVGDIVKSWAEQVRKRIVSQSLEHPDDDQYIPEGYRLSASYPRKIVNPKKLMTILRKRFGPKALLEEITIPLTNFEKRLSESAERGKKQAAVDEFAAELEAAKVVERSTVPVVALRMK